MDNYDDIRKLLKPRRDITASDGLRASVKKAIKNKQRKNILRKWLVGGISISAVAAVLLLALIPTGMSAKEILTQAINAFGNSENIEMKVEVRTRPVENFRYIDINDNFVSHHILISSSNSVLKWRIDKGERAAMGTGNEMYTWIPNLKMGWRINDSDYENLLGYMAILLRPKDILETELDNCINTDNADYHVGKSEDDIILTIHSGPQGNFENPYLLNTSIMESENIRRYVIDADSKRLKSVTVSVISGKREVTVLKVTDIIYKNQSDNIRSLPEDLRFVEFDNQPDGLTGLSAEEAASIFLNAFAGWNDEIIDKMLMHEMQNSIYREHYRGARLDSIGRSFTSGSGNSVFVPYKLKLRDGTIHRHNIALQKTHSGSWVVVGGL